MSSTEGECLNVESTEDRHVVKVVAVHEKTQETNNNSSNQGNGTKDLDDFFDKSNQLNKAAYLRLHRNDSVQTVATNLLKAKFEPPADKKQEEESPKSNGGDIQELKVKYSPSSYGYPKVLPLKPVLLPKPKLPVAQPRLSLAIADHNHDQVPLKNFSSNRASVLDYRTDHSNLSIIKRAESQDSVRNFEKELSYFTMDKKAKKSNSIKKLFTGSFFGSSKEKKQHKEDDRTKNIDNLQNESNFTRNTPHRHTISQVVTPPSNHNQNQNKHNISPELLKEIEIRYAAQHKNNFENVRRTFNEPKLVDYTDNKDRSVKPTISSYIKPEIQRYIDNSSSSTLESDRTTTSYENSLVAQAELLKIRQNEDYRRINGLERIGSFRSNRETPPRAQETNQNLKVIKPKAERALPNPYEDDQKFGSPKTIERNLNRNDTTKKEYLKTNVPPSFEETYGTVFDNIERRSSVVRSPTPSLEVTKLKLPPNRDLTPLTPRLKSPNINDKVIATELLKNSRAGTPQLTRQFSFGKNSVDTMLDECQKYSARSPPQHFQSSEDILSQRGSLVMRSPTPNRSSTPLGHATTRLSTYVPTSPQKEEIKKNVEAYFWKEMKKLKEQKDREILDHAEHQIVQHRSRSINSGFDQRSRGGRRSLSLPRDVQPIRYVARPTQVGPEQIYGYTTHQPQQKQQQQFLYPQQTAFVRSSPQRRTISSTGLNNSNFDQQYHVGNNFRPVVLKKLQENKKVSFSESGEQSWPTRNGFTKSPPQRRLIEKRIEDDGDVVDDVFQDHLYASRGVVYDERGGLYYQSDNQQGRARLQTAQVPYRVTRHGSLQMDQSPYVNYQLRHTAPEQDEIIVDSQVIPVEKVIYNDRPSHQNQQAPIYGRHVQHKPPIYATRPTTLTDGIYGQRQLYYNEPRSMQSPSYEPQYGQHRANPESQYGQHRANPEPQYGQHRANPEALYGQTRAIVEPQYGQARKVSVRNQVCDIYGQIHDTTNNGGQIYYPQQSGVLLGQLQQNSPDNQGFQRGTRLTSSANDMYKRVNYVSGGNNNSNNNFNQPRYVMRPRASLAQNVNDYNFDPNNRPLPPVPPKGKRASLQQQKAVAASDTESGSEEIRKIMNLSESNNSKSNKAEKNKEVNFSKPEKPKRKGFFRRS